MAIKAIVFDIGGVLEHTPDTGIMERWEERLALPAGEFRVRVRQAWRAGGLEDIPASVLHKNLCAATGMDDAQADSFTEDFWREYLGQPNTELIAFFAGLRPAYKTAMLSNSYAGARQKEQALYGFEDMTDVIIYSHEVGLLKPDPRIYALTCARLEVEPVEMIFLDDFEPNIMAARVSGIHGILFQNTAQAIADIHACLLASCEQ